MKHLLFVLLLGGFANALADGPGSRIRATPEPPQPVGPHERDVQRCQAMSGEERQRCLSVLRSAKSGVQREPQAGPSADRPGPESAGGGTNAGAGASTGTSGASSAVGGLR